MFDLPRVAHHEAGHALRGHFYGLNLSKITVQEKRNGVGSYTHFLERPGDATTAQISLAGPLAEIRFGYPDNFRQLRLSESAVLEVLHRSEWVDRNNGSKFRFYELHSENFLETECRSGDDFGIALDAIISSFLQRLHIFPSVQLIMRVFRMHEQACNVWLDENWNEVGLLAQAIMAQKRTARGHYNMTKLRFRKWTIDNNLSF